MISCHLQNTGHICSMRMGKNFVQMSIQGQLFCFVHMSIPGCRICHNCCVCSHSPWGTGRAYAPTDTSRCHSAQSSPSPEVPERRTGQSLASSCPAQAHFEAVCPSTDKQIKAARKWIEGSDFALQRACDHDHHAIILRVLAVHTPYLCDCLLKPHAGDSIADPLHNKYLEPSPLLVELLLQCHRNLHHSFLIKQDPLLEADLLGSHSHACGRVPIDAAVRVSYSRFVGVKSIQVLRRRVQHTVELLHKLVADLQTSPQRVY